MAKVITVQISDSDYADLVFHFSRRRGGKPLVGVEAVLDSLTNAAIGKAIREAAPRTRTVTKQRAEYLANKTYADGAYSAERYGPDEWRKAANFLAAHGFRAEEIVEILNSKWMRWAADSANATEGKASHLRAYVKAMHGDEFLQAETMLKEGK